MIIPRQTAPALSQRRLFPPVRQIARFAARIAAAGAMLAVLGFSQADAMAAVHEAGPACFLSQ